MALTGKQKRALRSKGQKMGDDIRMGKGGLSEGFLTTVRTLLARKELIKLRLTDEVQGPERKLVGEEIAAAVDAECITVVGQTALLYRANPELPPAKRVLREEDAASTSESEDDVEP